MMKTTLRCLSKFQSHSFYMMYIILAHLAYSIYSMRKIVKNEFDDGRIVSLCSNVVGGRRTYRNTCP